MKDLRDLKDLTIPEVGVVRLGERPVEGPRLLLDQLLELLHFLPLPLFRVGFPLSVQLHRSAEDLEVGALLPDQAPAALLLQRFHRLSGAGLSENLSR